MLLQIVNIVNLTWVVVVVSVQVLVMVNIGLVKLYLETPLLMQFCNQMIMLTIVLEIIEVVLKTKDYDLYAFQDWKCK